MRCLHCGNTLSVLQKLSESEFCSAEHRDRFQSEQQRLILERLRDSGTQLQRARAIATKAAKYKKAFEDGPPAARALSPVLQPQGCGFRLSGIGPQELVSFHLAAPPVPVGAVVTGFAPTRNAAAPAPRYNDGLRWCQDLLLKTGVAYGAHRAKLARGRRAWGWRGALAPYRRPAVRDCVPALADIAVEQIFDGASAGVPALHAPAIEFTLAWITSAILPERISADARGGVLAMALQPAPELTVSSVQRPRLVVVRISAASLLSGTSAAWGEALPLTGPFQVDLIPSAAAIGVAPGTPLMLRSQATSTSSEPAFKAMLRFSRPRFIPIDSTTSLEHNPGSPITPSAATLNTCATPILHTELELPSATRLFRARPRTAVADPAVIGLAANSTEHEPSTAAPAVQHVAIADCAPSSQSRLCAADPGGPVDVAPNGSGDCIASAEPPAGKPAGPTLIAIWALPEPSHISRMFRPRAIIASSPTGENPRPGSPSATHLKPELPAILPSAWNQPAPEQLQRMFRARPRTGVESATGDAYTAQAVNLNASPALPVAFGRAWNQPEPAQVERMFRARPRTGVPGAIDQVQGVCAAEPAAAPVVPNRAHTSWTDARPAQIERMFRPRPRAASSESSAASDIPAVAENVAPRPVLPATPPGTWDHPEPARNERMFRARPRTGVADPAVGEMGSAAGEIEPLHPPAAMPRADIPSCSAIAAERLYIARPRGGVRADTPSHAVIAAEAMTIAPAPMVGQRTAHEAKSEPARVERLFRARPRSGVDCTTVQEYEPQAHAWAPRTAKPGAANPAGALQPAIAGFHEAQSGSKSSAVAELETIRPSAIASTAAAAHPVNSIAVAGPAECRRLVRVRLRPVGEQATLRSACEPLQFAAEPSHATLDPLTVLEPGFLNRLYRMRLRKPAEDPDTVTQDIRCHRVAETEPDPVLATMPREAGQTAGMSLLQKLYRMRPRSGKNVAMEPAPIPCTVLPSSGGGAAPRAGKEALRVLASQWRAMPLTMKTVTMLVPMLLMLAFVPSTPIGEDDVRTAGMSDMSGVLGPIRNAMQERAAIDLSDDFRAGLGRWDGADNWRNHGGGGVLPRGLGLLKDSMGLTNYRVDFTAQIVHKGFSVALRAQDEQNFSALRLSLADAKPLTSVVAERYTVVDGKATTRQRVPLPVQIHKDGVLRVSLELHDQYFTLMLQEKVVDSWSETQFSKGGIGFFASAGEEGLIQTVRLSHQDDTIGRICAALALRKQ